MFEFVKINSSGYHIFENKVAVAIAVMTTGAFNAFRIDGKELSVEDMREITRFLINERINNQHQQCRKR